MASWEDFSRIIAEAKESKKLDPVGKEDADINNNGIDNDKSDQYLRNRRSSVGAAIAADRKKKPMVKISVPEKKLGYKVADIGPDGKEHNVKTYGNYKEALDPVGQEDDDIDNDGKKNTTTDKYLLNRRKVRGKIIHSKVTEDCGSEDSDENENNSSKKISPEEMKTKVNLAKTKLRMLGLKMSYEPEGELVDEAIAGLRPASERTKNTITPAQRKKQDQERKKKEELAHKAGLVIAGMTKTIKSGEVTQSKPKSDAPESNRKLKPGQKKDTLAVKADKIISSSYEPEGELVDESKSDKKLPDYKRSAARLARYNNPSGALALGGGQQRARRAEHEERRGVKKEEVSLVDMMIAQFSPLNEASQNTIPGGKRRKGLSKTIQSRQVDKLADEGDYERADKLQDVSSVKLKKNKSQPTASKSPESKPEKKQESTSKKETASKSTATERAARTTASARIRAARIARETEKEKREYKEKIRQEKKSEQQAGAEDRRKSAEEKQQKLKQIEKEKRADSAEKSAQREYDAKQSKKEKLRKEIGAATQVKPLNAVSSKESDAKAVGPAVQAAGQIAAIPFKLAGVALKNSNLRRKEKQREKAGKEAKEKSLKDDSQNESFCNWREEFILEVDDQVVNPDQKKIIDVSKKKNNIEINPKIDEAAPLALLAPLAGKIVGGKVAAGITAKGAGIAAKGGLRQKAVEFAAKKGGEMTSSAVQNKLDPEGKHSSDSSETGISGMLSKLLPTEKRKIVDEAAAWTRSAGKNKSGGLNEKGRKSYEAENPGSDLKAPSKTVGNPRRASFCARMSGMKAKLTSAKTARDPDSRINKSLRAWNC